MPIKFTFKKLPVDSDGKAYESLEAFQAAEIKKLVPILNIDTAAQLVEQKDWIIEILELTMDARPAARGMPKKRRQKDATAQPQFPQEAA